MWYSYSNILQYNAVYNFIIGSRGSGKSFGAKKLVINQFIKKGLQFIYIRRYKTELQKIQTFFDDIRQQFPDHELTVKGKVFYIDGKIAGWAIPLQTSQIEKQNSYKGVKYVIFDEFLIDSVNSAYKYLKDEYSVMANLYSTIDRDRDQTIVLFIGNAISMSNPYFDELNIRPSSNINVKYKTDSNGYKKALATIEVFQDTEQVQNQRNTRFGLLTADTEIDAFMHDNVFYLDDNTMMMDIPKNPNRYEVFVNLYYQGQTYSILMLRKQQLILLCKYVPNDFTTYSLLQRDISRDHPLLPDNIKCILKQLIKRYQSLQLIQFDTQQTRLFYFNLTNHLGIK